MKEIKVKTKYGNGVVTGKNSQLVEVRFTKKDFVGKDGDITRWLLVTEFNGPCCFKWFKLEDLEILN